MKNCKNKTLVLCLLLCGCVSQQSLPTLPGKNQWQLSGKIGLVYPESNCRGEDCRQRSDQGKIAWQQNINDYSVDIADPFGRVVMTITGDDKALLATSAKQKTLKTTPDEFVALLVGNTDNPALSNLSPAWLKYWVTGRPAPALDVDRDVANGFKQAGYLIVPSGWQPTPVGEMPSVITVTKARFTLRLAVKKWQALP